MRQTAGVRELCRPSAGVGHSQQRLSRCIRSWESGAESDQLSGLESTAAAAGFTRDAAAGEHGTPVGNVGGVRLTDHKGFGIIGKISCPAYTLGVESI